MIIEKYEEVSDQLLFWGRLIGLKRIYSDFSERKWTHYLATGSQVLVFLGALDSLFYSRRFMNQNDLLQLTSNCK